MLSCTVILEFIKGSAPTHCELRTNLYREVLCLLRHFCTEIKVICDIFKTCIHALYIHSSFRFKIIGSKTVNCLEVLWTESSVATRTEHKLFGYPFSRRSSTTNTRCWTQSFRGHLLHHCAIGDASKLDWHIIWLALFLLQLWFLLFYLLRHLFPLDKTVLVELLTWAGIRHICLCVVKFGSPHALARNTPCLLKNIYQ